MVKVHKTPLPPASGLHRRFKPGDFLDTYGAPSDMSVQQAADIIGDLPGWIAGLIKLRGVLVAPFGLKAEPPDTGNGQVGIFPLVSRTEDELIGGFDDKHLNFLVSISRHDGRVHLSTWVRPHNLWGRAYLAAIMPFHKLVAKSSVARVAKAAPTVGGPATAG